MQPLDTIILKLRPSKGATTRIAVCGSLRLHNASCDARTLLRILGRAADPICIALPADAPWSWLELWSEHIEAAEGHLQIRFVLPRRAAAQGEP